MQVSFRPGCLQERSPSGTSVAFLADHYVKMHPPSIGKVGFALQDRQPKPTYIVLSKRFDEIGQIIVVLPAEFFVKPDGFLYP